MPVDVLGVNKGEGETWVRKEGERFGEDAGIIRVATEDARTIGAHAAVQKTPLQRSSESRIELHEREPIERGLRGKERTGVDFELVLVDDGQTGCCEELKVAAIVRPPVLHAVVEDRAVLAVAVELLKGVRLDQASGQPIARGNRAGRHRDDNRVRLDWLDVIVELEEGQTGLVVVWGQ